MVDVFLIVKKKHPNKRNSKKRQPPNQSPPRRGSHAARQVTCRGVSGQRRVEGRVQGDRLAVSNFLFFFHAPRALAPAAPFFSLSPTPATCGRYSWCLLGGCWCVEAAAARGHVQNVPRRVTTDTVAPPPAPFPQAVHAALPQVSDAQIVLDIPTCSEGGQGVPFPRARGGQNVVISQHAGLPPARVGTRGASRNAHVGALHIVESSSMRGGKGGGERFCRGRGQRGARVQNDPGSAPDSCLTQVLVGE